MENQTQLLYPYAIIRFKGQIYQTSPTFKSSTNDSNSISNRLTTKR